MMVVLVTLLVKKRAGNFLLYIKKCKFTAACSITICGSQVHGSLTDRLTLISGCVQKVLHCPFNTERALSMKTCLKQ